MNNKISILGCGWFGLELGRVLNSHGFSVTGSTTSANKLPLLAAAGIVPVLLNIFEPGSDGWQQLLSGSDVLIFTVPPGASGYNIEKYLEAVKRLTDECRVHSSSKIIFTSSTGIYAKNAGIVNESTPAVPDTVAGKILLEAEKTLQSASGLQTTILRFAGLVGPGRDPGRFLAGKVNAANGLCPINLLHLDDAVGVCHAVIEKNLFNIVINACTPDHPARQEFYTLAATKSGLVTPLFTSDNSQSKTVTSLYTGTMLQYVYKVSHWLRWLNKR